VTPHIGEHETPGGRSGLGLGGVMAAGVMPGLGPGSGLGGYGLGGYGGHAGYGYGGPHQMSPRADVRRGLLIPETEDLAALTTSGADPTVLAFALVTPARSGAPPGCQLLSASHGPARHDPA
jgi:hypothetical protein